MRKIVFNDAGHMSRMNANKASSQRHLQMMSQNGSVTCLLMTKMQYDRRVG